MAGAAGSLLQSLFAWAPPCAPNGRCPQAPLLATQKRTGTSAIDGTISFGTASLPGEATNQVGLAVTGISSALCISIEQHPYSAATCTPPRASHSWSEVK